MAKFYYSLAAKVADSLGRQEVVIRCTIGRIEMNAKSGIYAHPDFFEYFVNKKKSKTKADKVTLAEAETKKEDIHILRHGEMKKLDGRYNQKNPRVKEHQEATSNLDKMKVAIEDAIKVTDKKSFDREWLKNQIYKFHHPDAMTEEEKENAMSFYDMAELYISKHESFSGEHIKCIRVVVRSIARYELYVRATDKKRKDFVWSANTLTKDIIEDWIDYIRNEKGLADEYPELFEKLCSQFPTNVKANRNPISGRGANVVIKYQKRLKAILNWLNEKGYINNHPFEGIKIGCEEYGTPFYITLEERNKIASTPMKTKHLETQRDIFVFQCYVGCRVGDLYSISEQNIENGILEYTPHKTKGKGEAARVPLLENAITLIEKYRGQDKQGRLFPFISEQKYNDAIKEIFKESGITRNVEVRNALTGETEIKPINEVASSHMARRTFVGNLYFKVQDPSLIGKMSGHVEGSTAFARYRKVEDDTLRSTIDLIK